VAEPDIINDFIARMASRLGADGVDVMAGLEDEMRSYWSGDTVYVKQANKKSRDSAIRQAYRTGSSLSDLAQRYQLGTRRVQQILRVRDT